MTAIASQEDFVDDFLDELLPTIRQEAAAGLRYLAVAATSTGPERAVQEYTENCSHEGS
jgi:hypothetical protein